jgi:hypothetical protein
MIESSYEVLNSTFTAVDGAFNAKELYNVIKHIGHLDSSGAAWFYVGFVANILFLGEL